MIEILVDRAGRYRLLDLYKASGVSFPAPSYYARMGEAKRLAREVFDDFTTGVPLTFNLDRAGRRDIYACPQILRAYAVKLQCESLLDQLKPVDLGR